MAGKKDLDISDELIKIYQDARKEGIWLREWAGGLTAAGYMKKIEEIERVTGRKIDISKLTLGDCVNLAEPGTGKTREEACRNAIMALKRHGVKRRKEITMMNRVKLYDIRKRNYPHKRGDRFRSLQVFGCYICGAITNMVIMGGYPGYGIRAVCPNSSECWHHELEEKIEWADKPHPSAYKADLQKEINEMKRKNQKNVKNDIEGKPDKKLRLSVTNTFSWKPRSSCTHRRHSF